MCALEIAVVQAQGLTHRGSITAARLWRGFPRIPPRCLIQWGRTSRSRPAPVSNSRLSFAPGPLSRLQHGWAQGGERASLGTTASPSGTLDSTSASSMCAVATLIALRPLRSSSAMPCTADRRLVISFSWTRPSAVIRSVSNLPRRRRVSKYSRHTPTATRRCSFSKAVAHDAAALAGT
jgi:hypothetical protein